MTSQGEYSGQVLHFSNSGAFLGVLGANDATRAPLAFPGTLAFGPDGNLYVADLGSNAIFQFDTSSTTQQYQAADTLGLPTGFTPGGFTFADDGSGDLIVGSLEYGSVACFQGTNPVPVSTPVAAGSGIDPAAIVALSNGNLLIADTDFDRVATAHHEIMEYDAATGVTSQFINLTTPTDSSGDLPQPTSLMLDTDGNLLVGLSPDDFDDGAVEKFNVQTGAPIETITAGVGDPSGLALVPQFSEMTAAASDWTNSGYAGVTIAHADGTLHVYGTGSTSDVVPPQLAGTVSGIQVTGPDNAADALTVDFGGGSPIPADGVTFNGGSGTATNSVIISGSSDLSGSMQITGSVTLGYGSVTSGMPASSPFSIESGTIVASLTGSGGLIKAGAGAATLSGSNSYQGDTTIAGGTLDVTTAAALPAGTALAVGAGGTFIFGDPVHGSPALSGDGASAGVASAATESMDAPVAAPLQVPTLVSDSRAALVSDSTAVAAFLPSARPASPSHAASDSLWKNYDRSTGPTIAQVADIAGWAAWWNSSGGGEFRGFHGGNGSAACGLGRRAGPIRQSVVDFFAERSYSVAVECGLVE